MILLRAFSAVLFFVFSLFDFEGLKKGKRDLVWFLMFYGCGCFLVTSIARTAPMMTMTTMTATNPYSIVVFEAKPLIGDAIGAWVAIGEPA